MRCRLCLRNCPEGRSILNSKLKCADLTLTDALYWIFGVKVDENDPFSKCICLKCENVIKYIGKYRTLFQKNQSMLEEKQCYQEEEGRLNQTDNIEEQVNHVTAEDEIAALPNPSPKMKRRRLKFIDQHHETPTTAKRDLIREKNSPRTQKNLAKEKYSTRGANLSLYNVNEEVNVLVCKFCSKICKTRQHLNFHCHSAHKTVENIVNRRRKRKGGRKLKFTRHKQHLQKDSASKLKRILSPARVGRTRKKFLWDSKKFPNLNFVKQLESEERNAEKKETTSRNENEMEETNLCTESPTDIGTVYSDGDSGDDRPLSEIKLNKQFKVKGFNIILQKCPMPAGGNKKEKGYKQTREDTVNNIEEMNKWKDDVSSSLRTLQLINRNNSDKIENTGKMNKKYMKKNKLKVLEVKESGKDSDSCNTNTNGQVVEVEKSKHPDNTNKTEVFAEMCEKESTSATSVKVGSIGNDEEVKQKLIQSDEQPEEEKNAPESSNDVDKTSEMHKMRNRVLETLARIRKVKENTQRGRKEKQKDASRDEETKKCDEVSVVSEKNDETRDEHKCLKTPEDAKNSDKDLSITELETIGESKDSTTGNDDESLITSEPIEERDDTTGNHDKCLTPSESEDEDSSDHLVELHKDSDEVEDSIVDNREQLTDTNSSRLKSTNTIKTSASTPKADMVDPESLEEGSDPLNGYDVDDFDDHDDEIYENIDLEDCLKTTVIRVGMALNTEVTPERCISKDSDNYEVSTNLNNTETNTTKLRDCYISLRRYKFSKSNETSKNDSGDSGCGSIKQRNKEQQEQKAQLSATLLKLQHIEKCGSEQKTVTSTMELDAESIADDSEETSADDTRSIKLKVDCLLGNKQNIMTILNDQNKWLNLRDFSIFLDGCNVATDPRESIKMKNKIGIYTDSEIDMEKWRTLVPAGVLKVRLMKQQDKSSEHNGIGSSENLEICARDCEDSAVIATTDEAIQPEQQTGIITINLGGDYPANQVSLKLVNDKYRWLNLKDFHVSLEKCPVTTFLENNQIQQIKTETKQLKLQIPASLLKLSKRRGSEALQKNSIAKSVEGHQILEIDKETDCTAPITESQESETETTGKISEDGSVESETCDLDSNEVEMENPEDSSDLEGRKSRGKSLHTDEDSKGDICKEKTNEVNPMIEYPTSLSTDKETAKESEVVKENIANSKDETEKNTKLHSDNKHPIEDTITWRRNLTRALEKIRNIRDFASEAHKSKVLDVFDKRKNTANNVNSDIAVDKNDKSTTSASPTDVIEGTNETVEESVPKNSEQLPDSCSSNEGLTERDTSENDVQNTDVENGTSQNKCPKESENLQCNIPPQTTRESTEEDDGKTDDVIKMLKSKEHISATLLKIERIKQIKALQEKLKSRMEAMEHKKSTLIQNGSNNLEKADGEKNTDISDNGANATDNELKAIKDKTNKSIASNNTTQIKQDAGKKGRCCGDDESPERESEEIMNHTGSKNYTEKRKCKKSKCPHMQDKLHTATMIFNSLCSSPDERVPSLSRHTLQLEKQKTTSVTNKVQCSKSLSKQSKKKANGKITNEEEQRLAKEVEQLSKLLGLLKLIEDGQKTVKRKKKLKKGKSGKKDVEAKESEKIMDGTTETEQQNEISQENPDLSNGFVVDDCHAENFSNSDILSDCGEENSKLIPIILKM